jgi:hypothetical protein
LQPAASNRQIAKTLRVGETTIRRDTGYAPCGAGPDKNPNDINGEKQGGAPHGAQPATRALLAQSAQNDWL